MEPETGVERDLADVRRIVSGHLHDFRVQIFLFGSHARRDATRASDVDVALLPMEPLPIGVLSDVREALEESHVPLFVDLVDLSTAPDALRSRVLAEGIEWTVSTND